MTAITTSPNALPSLASITVPAVIAERGEAASKRFIEFFTANIRNVRTREAYARATTQFCNWLEQLNLRLEDLQPVVVASYIEQLGQTMSAPTVKQHLAALRMLFDYLVIGQIIPMNPAAGVRGPKHVYHEGKTPILTAEDARQLFHSINGTRLIDYRDRALLGLMVFSFARISAAIAMQVKDYSRSGTRAWFNLHEKGGKFSRIPAHHQAAEYIETYIEQANLHAQPKSPLFRSAGRGRGGNLMGNAMSRFDALAMVKRRAKAAGLSPELCNHSFRGAGITLFLENGGDLETAAWIAGHASTRTTQLYDRRKQELSQSEIERIRF